MVVNMQNPGGQAGVSRDRCHGGRWEPTITTQDFRAQMLASRYSLSPWIAREVSRLCFGEGCND